MQIATQKLFTKTHNKTTYKAEQWFRCGNRFLCSIHLACMACQNWHRQITSQSVSTHSRRIAIKIWPMKICTHEYVRHVKEEWRKRQSERERECDVICSKFQIEQTLAQRLQNFQNRFFDGFDCWWFQSKSIFVSVIRCIFNEHSLASLGRNM